MSSWQLVSHLASRISLLVLVAAFIGCGDGMVQIKATVTVDGEPYEGASVMFVPEDRKGKIAYGDTAKDGSVRLTSYKPFDGVKPGTYKVCVSKYIREEVPVASARKTQKANKKLKENKGATSGDEVEQDEAEMLPSRTKEENDARLQKLLEASLPKEGKIPMSKPLLPPQYALPKTTPFTCTVPPDGEVVFAVETKKAGRAKRR